MPRLTGYQQAQEQVRAALVKWQGFDDDEMDPNLPALIVHAIHEGIKLGRERPKIVPESLLKEGAKRVTKVARNYRGDLETNRIGVFLTEKEVYG